jgi:hypothetical protein
MIYFKKKRSLPLRGAIFGLLKVLKDKRSALAAGDLWVSLGQCFRAHSFCGYQLDAGQAVPGDSAPAVFTGFCSG